MYVGSWREGGRELKTILLLKDGEGSAEDSR